MSSRPFQRGSIVAGRYRIVAPLGGGASAKVYLADDQQLGRRVALKVLHRSHADDAAFLKRFRAEARSVAALNHPNIMHVYDSGDHPDPDGDIPFLVVEFVGGGSLRAVLDSGPPLSPSQALVVGLDAARGLEYAHQHGFVHRDIKPANLLFGEEGRLRIADFGIARAIAEAAWTEPQGMLVGTAKYASPEQALGRTVDGRADVYSLALVLVEAVTGEVPFARDTPQATLMARTEGDLPVPRSLGRLAPVLARAGRLDPELRPDAGELVIGFLAASEDMDRPAGIVLPGAITPEALDEIAAESAAPTEGDAVDASAASSTDEYPTPIGDDITQYAAGDRDETVVLGLPTVTTLTSSSGATGATGATGAGGGAVATATRTAPVPAAETGSTPAVAQLPRVIAEPPRGASGGEGDDDGFDDGYRPGRGPWPWITALLLILLLGGAGYWYFAVRTPTHGVIDASGMSLEDAKRQLEDDGFVVTTEFVRKDGTEPDEVVGQRPRPATELEEGKRVRLTVSLGNTLVDVPVLASSMDEAAVTKAIEDAGLTLGTRTDTYDESVAAGFLVSATPEGPIDPTGQVPKRSKIDVVISSGPTPRTMPPNLVGQSIDSVTRQLADIQLRVNVTEEWSDEPVGTVLGLNYADNAPVPRDTIVQASVSKGPELFPIPNVLGKTGDEAAKVLEAQGFDVAGITGSPSALVVGVAPVVGELRPKGTPVQILTNG